jgi:hypothetical protein
MVGNNSSTLSASEAAAVVRLADQLGESDAPDPTSWQEAVRTVLAIEAGTLRSGTEGLSQVIRELEATYA